MTRRWFGTDGVRGKAGTGPLQDAFLERLGLALAEQARGDGEGHDEPVFLARDTRASGPGIALALARGLTAGGREVVDLGVLPTAGLPMAMRARGASRGLVVSASHNPWQDNGVKIFGRGGHKLTDADEHALEARVEALGGEEPGGSLPAAEAAAPREEDGAAWYRGAMLDLFARVDLTGLRLAVDCAHGAAVHTAPAVLTALGAEVETLGDAPDGHNINAGCGSTHLETLAEATTAGGVDLGMAFDGDADRVLMVDTSGRTCSGDHMLGFLGTWLAGRGALPGDTVVATVMSNLGLELVLRERGIRLLRTAVGDRYVNAAMREGSYALGGEASGHLLFGAEHDNTGDGLYTALRVLEGLTDSGRTLGSVVDALPAVPQVLLNVPVVAKPPVERLPELQERVAALQGEHGDDVRIVLRYSGTESLARVMVEGLDAGVVERSSRELAELWSELVETYGSEGAPSA